MKIGVLIFVLTTLLVSCSPMRKFEGIEQIHFGSGGGFTGEVILNTLEKSGVVRKGGIEIKKLTPKETSLLFPNTHNLKSDTINKPGNMYHFIEFYDGSVKYRFLWNPAESPNKELDNWYNQLNDLVKKEAE